MKLWLFLLLFLSSCTHLKPKEFKSAIILGKDNIPKMAPVYTWRPSEAELRKAKNISLNYIKKLDERIYKKIDNYHLQLYGIGKVKNQKVHMNYYCDKIFSNSYVFVFDGGNCYFSIDVDLKNKKVISFDKNSEV